MRIAALGECMVELTGSGRDYRLGFAGDTFNTAVYLKRLLGDDAEVRYVTATGDDALSDSLVEAIAEEGIVPDLVRLPGASPALYIVSTDDLGERSFTYYRDASPVRSMFTELWDDAITARLLDSDLIYLSAITLQMLTAEALQRLMVALDAARARGALVAFDSNFRPRGWASAVAAAAAVGDVSQRTDIALPSLDDEGALRGCGSPTEVIAAYRGAGVGEVVVKDGSGAVTVSLGEGEGERTFPTARVERPIDTTGAGDSFNAAYLAARLVGADVAGRVAAAQQVAAAVIAAPGAIVPRADWSQSLGKPKSS